MKHYWLGYDMYNGDEGDDIIFGLDAAMARFNAIDVPYKRLDDMDDNVIAEYKNEEYWAEFDII